MEKKRLEKVRRIIFLETELWFFDHKSQDRADVKSDWGFIRAEDEVELTNLYLELYPLEPPKDLFEDVKKRMEAFKLAKEGTGNRIPSLTLKQKIGLLFKKN